MAKSPNEVHETKSFRSVCSRMGIYCVLLVGALILCVGLPLAAMRL